VHGAIKRDTTILRRSGKDKDVDKEVWNNLSCSSMKKKENS
jgi:hypothetical protein